MESISNEVDMTPEEKRNIRKTLCIDFINNKFPESSKTFTENDGIVISKNPNRTIQDADYLSSKLFAFIVDYDYEIVSKVIGSTEGLRDIAEKGLLDISIIAGLKGWSPEN